MNVRQMIEVLQSRFQPEDRIFLGSGDSDDPEDFLREIKYIQELMYHPNVASHERGWDPSFGLHSHCETNSEDVDENYQCPFCEEGRQSLKAIVLEA